ncbi:MAG: 30S ribosomal protein S8 [Candidatus Micrarchaeota archaeon]
MALDYLADALNTIKTHEMVGQKDCSVKATKLIGLVLDVLKTNRYIEAYEKVDNGRGGYFNITLAGRINNCGVIKPRFPVKKMGIPEAEQQYIPGVGVGLLILSTSAGLMTNAEAEQKKIGGRLIAYIY